LGDLRSQPAELTISAGNVGQLKVKWIFTTDGDVSATPTISSGAVYAPDWAGNIFAISAKTGQRIWQHQVAEYNGRSGSISRVSPLVLPNEVVIGDMDPNFQEPHGGANIIAVDPATGKRLWITQVETHAAAVITGSPVANNGVIYVGVSSTEEGLATVPGYACCTFRGSVVALDQRTGKILWKTFTIPDNSGVTGGFSGGSVWQSPAIDPSRNSLYIGVGNNYSVPSASEQCEASNLASGSSDTCTPPDDHADSAMALDLTTGAMKWSTKTVGYDVWNLDCFISLEPGATPCPNPAGPDFDFSGSGPNLIGNIVGFGQKSGMYWAFDPGTGNVLWSQLVGPGGPLGGTEWGTASDGTAIYVPTSDSAHLAYTLPNGNSITWGSWAALDVKTGNLLWQIADPTSGTADIGAASVANGVVYVGSLSGFMYALNAKTGTILWSFNSGGSVIDGPSIVNGVVYWGSGYSRHSSTPGIGGTGNDKIFAFSLN
jgi:polyvinyl alcohol dehydrogenase (cytochrome)